MFPSRRIATSGGDVFRNEYSLEFDGSNDYISIADTNDLSFGDGSNDTPLTISVWAKLPTIASTHFIGKGHYGSNYEYNFHIGSDKKFYWILYDQSSGGYIGRIFNTALDSYENKWTHFCGTYDGGGADSGVKLYINGMQVDDTNGGVGSYTAMENLGAEVRIMRGNTNYADGKIDELAIWNTALTSSQVKTLYNNREPFNAKNIALSSLKGFWRMGDGVLDHKQTNGLVADQVNATLSTLVEDDCADSGLGDWSGDATEAFDTDHYDLTYSGNGNHGMDATIVASQLYKLTCDIKIKTDYSGTLKYFTYDGSGTTYTSDFKSEVNDSSYTTITKYLVANSSGGSGTAGFSVNTVGVLSIKNFKVESVTHDLVSYWSLDETAEVTTTGTATAADSKMALDNVNSTLGTAIVDTSDFSGWTFDSDSSYNSDNEGEFTDVGGDNYMAIGGGLLVANTVYYFSVTHNISSGDFTCGDNSGSSNVTTITGVGTTTGYFWSVGGLLVCRGNQIGTISNLVVKPVNGNGGALI